MHDTRARRQLSGRLALIVLVLAGLFGMHGLSSNHDIGVDLGGLLVRASADKQQSPARGDLMFSSLATSASPAQPAVHDVAAMAPGATHPAHDPERQPDHGALMGLCLAVPAGTALVLLLLALILLGRAPASRLLTRCWTAFAPKEPPPPYASPRLSKLCVSRT